MVICLVQGADLHMAQRIPLSLTVSCFSKIQIGFYLSGTGSPGCPGQRAIKRVCVCVLVNKCLRDTASSYLEDVCVYVSSAAGCHLCCAARCDLVTSWMQLLQYGPRSFAVSGLVSWNTLPVTVHRASLCSTVGWNCNYLPVHTTTSTLVIGYSIRGG